MAGEFPALVIDERQAAEFALDDLAAGTAHDKGRKPPAVQHDDNLLPLAHGFFDKLPQRLGKNMAVAHTQFLAHIHTLHHRQRHIANTLGHGQQGKLTLLSAVITFHGRCRTAQQ